VTRLALAASLIMATATLKLQPHDRALVLGITGAGKSYYAMHNIVKPAPRVVVFDPHGEYADACDLDEVSLGELLEEPALLTYADVRLAVVPDEWDEPRELAEALKDLSRVLKRTAVDERDPKAPVTLLVIEECGVMRPYADGTLAMLATQARHWKMPLVLVAQRAVQIPPNARDQASRIVTFRQKSADDVDALAARIGEAKAARVPLLPRRKFVSWHESEDFA